MLVWNVKLLQVHGLITFGQLLDASSLQAALAVAVCFVGLGLERMAQYIDSTKVVYAASTAVLSLCEGNAALLQSVRSGPRVRSLLERVLLHYVSGMPLVLERLAYLYLQVHGVGGVLASIHDLKQDPGAAEEVISALVHILARADESIALDLGVVRAICDLGTGPSSRRVAAMAAVGRLAELALQDAKGTQVAKGTEVALGRVSWIVLKLREEVGMAVRRDFHVYHAALSALTALALRSDRIYRGVLEGGIGVLIDQIIEDDYWNFTFNTLERVVYAMVLFGSVEALLQKLAKYPDAPVLAECSFKTLTEITDAATRWPTKGS